MRKRFARLLAVSIFPVLAAVAQPDVTIQALNSAVVRGPSTLGSGIAQGSIFTIYGSGLGPSTLIGASTFPLPAQLGGSSVKVTVNGTQVDAIILAAAGSQINAILPSNTPLGAGTFTVTYNGQTSSPAAIQVVDSAVGIYTFGETGSGQAIATDVNYGLNSIIHTFHPGDYGILWATGLGAISGSDAALPPVRNLAVPVKVYVGNTTARINYHGRSGCCAGLDQIVFQIPAGVTGCYVPVAVEAGGITGNIANITTIAVSDTGHTCTDSVMGQDLVEKLASGQNASFGYIRLESGFSQLVAGSAGAASLDSAMASFSRYTPSTAGMAEYGVSSGYCVAVDCSYNNGSRWCFGVNTSNFSLQDSGPAQLDAGTLSVQKSSPPASLTEDPFDPGYYGAFLSQTQRYLWSGLAYPIVGTGGKDVGAFTVTDQTSIPSVKFTSIGGEETISRSGDFTVNWTGGDPAFENGEVTIGAISENGSNTPYQAEAFQCTAPQAAGKFTIPAWIMALMPVSGSGTAQNGNITYPLGWIWIGQYNNPTAFSATGLDKAIATDIFYNGALVYFK